jgi:hypothetical protein
VIRTVLSMLIAIIVGGLTLSLTGVIHNPNPPSTLIALGLGVIALVALLLVNITRARVVLEADHIEVTRSIWPTRRIDCSDIVARRVHPAGWRAGVGRHITFW